MNADEREAIQARLHILEALSLALERSRTTLDLVAEAEGRDQALLALQKHLSLDSAQAAAVLDISVGKFTKTGADRVRAEWQELRARLGRG